MRRIPSQPADPVLPATFGDPRQRGGRGGAGLATRPRADTVAAVASEPVLPAGLSPASATTRTGVLDAESRRWLEALSGSGHAREAAVARLHELLLRAARFEVARRRRSLPYLRGGDHDDLAQQSADDALVAILAKLPTFRGDSRFTTWAYKFALYEAAVKLRRRAWQDRELPLEPDSWPDIASRALSPADHASETELLTALLGAIRDALSAHQREVLVAVTLNGVPIDVLAERLDTTRGALYKTLHDARRKLRARLAASGHDPAGDSGRHQP
jgi:RNA polymerase sigma-70 factor (ECF subfamily)